MVRRTLHKAAILSNWLCCKQGCSLHDYCSGYPFGYNGAIVNPMGPLVVDKSVMTSPCQIDHANHAAIPLFDFKGYAPHSSKAYLKCSFSFIFQKERLSHQSAEHGRTRRDLARAG